MSSETYEVVIPADAMTALSELYAQAPEPTRGKTHEEGRYQVQIDGFEFRQVAGKGVNEGKTYTVFMFKSTVIGPPELVSDDPKRNILESDRFLKDEQSMSYFKGDLKALGLDPSVPFESLPAQLATLRGAFFEVQVSHTAKKDKDTGKASATDFWQNLRIIRRIDEN